MQTKIITISREFGSGGRTIGKQIANKLGITYYDKELVKQIATETGFHEDFVADASEYAPSNSWLSYVFNAHGANTPIQSMSMNDLLWSIQYRLISELADKEPCVIVGRCADFILREREDCFHAFIYSPMPARAERIVRLYGDSEQSPEKRLADKDKKRRIYYRHYTGRDWGNIQNYHLSLDSSKIGIDNCVDLIINASNFKL